MQLKYFFTFQVFSLVSQYQVAKGDFERILFGQFETYL